ncbi:ribonuclease P protein subunit p25-like protein [Melanotaenia boesemani]|uniref:ribonuclease P protein subunit p25-like protein n=1 Tax=Melanotaenia boesemani TaxID=1250792 RepID=UPI001C03FB78|nr:ribonuclease P protein subunit p25-like protein [Melanotaenia boesemani]XP_041856989.1 ribonuclease P protein subunit p25-like protein [Melanotaenia boesemani]XP_041856990.1 ribonuclease P protein subunit p25-like protein [Melanotaenia boesemani]XP_041856991.1 ribonuclease P protein subunit p25-like protein [Melanotaenia boesemani]
MENYSKARTVEQPSVCPFTGLSANTPEILVRDGSKIRNLLRFALSRMEAKPRGSEEEGRPTAEDGHQEGQQGAPGRPPCKQVVFTASGKGVSKAITCAEIVKRRVKGLHQLTRLLYGTVVEVWEPLEPAAGLDSLNVSRNLPAIWILLSKEPLDCSQPGYQAPGCYDALWAQTASREEGGGLAGQKPGHRRKRGGGGGSRGKGPHRQTGRSREPVKGQS